MRRSVSAAPAVTVAAAPAVIAGARGVVHAGSKGCANHHGRHIVTCRIHRLHRLGRVVTTVVVIVFIDHGRRHGRGGVRGLGRLVGAVVTIAAVGAAVGCGLHAQCNPVARRRGGPRRVVAARVLIDHVVGHGAVLVVGLGGAVAHRLVLGLLSRGFRLVAQHGAANHAGCRGRSASAAVADGVAHHAARQRTQHGARARGAALARVDVLIAADLLGHGHLLRHRGHGKHPALLLGQGYGGGRGRQRQKNQGFHDCTPVALAVLPARLHASVFLGPEKQFAAA